MKLKAFERRVEQKGDNKRLRRQGLIPAVLYVRGKEGRMISIEEAGFSALLRKITPGTLSTVVVTLELNGAEHRVLVKDIQYAVTTYRVIHLDFEELKEGMPVTVNVPVRCISTADCVGVKGGGMLRQVARAVKVRCLPKDMPAELVIDVKDLDLNKARRLSDLELPAGVKPLTKADEIIVSVSKR